jgi:hypothetical protein
MFIFKCLFLHVANQVRPPHPLIFGRIHCLCGQPLDPMGIHLLCCAHGGERISFHAVIWDAFTSIARNVKFHICKNKLMFFHCLFLSPFVDRSTLFYLRVVFAHWSLLSLLTSLEQIGITSSSFPWGGCNSGYLGEGRALSQPLPNVHVSPSCHGGFWVSSLVGRQLSLSMC